MTNQSLSRLLYLCQEMPALFSKIPEDELVMKPSPEKWSKKEILGHLIDSATNNHHRFVRGQFEETPTVDYDGDHWVNCSRYQSMPIQHMILFWEIYNRHIAEVIQRIPGKDLQRLCDSGDPEPYTLEWLFDDYVVHLEHHLHQIVEY